MTQLPLRLLSRLFDYSVVEHAWNSCRIPMPTRVELALIQPPITGSDFQVKMQHAPGELASLLIVA